MKRSHNIPLIITDYSYTQKVTIPMFQAEHTSIIQHLSLIEYFFRGGAIRFRERRIGCPTDRVLTSNKCLAVSLSRFINQRHRDIFIGHYNWNLYDKIGIDLCWYKSYYYCTGKLKRLFFSSWKKELTKITLERFGLAKHLSVTYMYILVLLTAWIQYMWQQEELYYELRSQQCWCNCFTVVSVP